MKNAHVAVLTRASTMRGELRWDKFIKTIGNVSQQDQQVLLQLAQFGKDVNLLDFVPGGLRTSYVG